VGVKAPQFSFLRLEGADPTLGVEMASTGEVGCLGSDFEEAFLKALLSVGYRMPIRSVLLSTGPIVSKAQFVDSARALHDSGVQIYATHGTAEFLRANHIASTRLYWPLEEKQPNVLDYLSNGSLDLVVNIPKNDKQEELTNDYLIRRRAVDFGVPLITNLQLAEQFVRAVTRKKLVNLETKSWNEYRRHAADDLPAPVQATELSEGKSWSHASSHYPLKMAIDKRVFATLCLLLLYNSPTSLKNDRKTGKGRA
jgi:carbamoyl-phosphate synthase large subunit